VRTLEATGGVGGTCYWNHDPGARFDSKSWTYGYPFSQALLDHWDRSEHFAPQPETDRYLNDVADMFDLRRDIPLNTRVAAAPDREDTRSGEVMLADGGRHATQYLIRAIGILSAPPMPDIPGVALFEGESCHTDDWPEEGIDFAGTRVEIIGTGANGRIQVHGTARMRHDGAATIRRVYAQTDGASAA
jgi:cation diffusion facilitator CzcD-associated flavoprotein CzcO